MQRRSVGWWRIVAVAIALSLLLSHSWDRLGKATAGAPFQIAQAPSEETIADPLASVVSGLYEDPEGNFQIAILEGFGVNTVAGAPLFQTVDGNLAYSVVQVPLATAAPLPEIGLVEIAQQTLGNGEGFQTQTFSPLAGGGLQIAWSGRLSQGAAPPQSVSGTILAKQQGPTAYLLVVAALAEAEPQVPFVVTTLAETLEIL